MSIFYLTAIKAIKPTKNIFQKNIFLNEIFYLSLQISFYYNFKFT